MSPHCINARTSVTGFSKINGLDALTAPAAINDCDWPCLPLTMLSPFLPDKHTVMLKTTLSIRDRTAGNSSAVPKEFCVDCKSGKNDG